MPVLIALGAKNGAYYIMNKIYIHRGSSVLYVVLAVLSSVAGSLIAHELIVKRPKTVLQSRQKLRDTFGERLSEYMELLVESLLLVVQAKVVHNADYAYHLQRVEYFLKHASLSETCDYSKAGEVLEQIAHVQKELLRTFRSLLERDADSSFVTCRIRSHLEQYVQKVEEFIKEEKKYQRIFKQRS
jgi:hypothetical protein